MLERSVFDTLHRSVYEVEIVRIGLVRIGMYWSIGMMEGYQEYTMFWTMEGGRGAWSLLDEARLVSRGLSGHKRHQRRIVSCCKIRLCSVFFSQL